MDDRLYKRLEKIEQSIDELREVEMTYLQLEGNRKALLATLTLSSSGKSFAEREAQALASEAWSNFMTGHAKAEGDLNHARRMYELRLKAYDAEHLTLKTETPAIRRQA